uniref:Uncharacterized protein n=1 Tax=Percolomonas cosmopolitus TaxID=63605 RepID=A0A7S1KRN1_9EUKA
MHIPVKQGEPAADKMRPPPSLELAVDVLKHLTASFHRENKERPIVIIDQVNFLENTPQAIHILRAVGENASNYQTLPRLVYVTSDHLLNNHFASLVRSRPFMVHEMSEENAITYLKEKLKIQNEEKISEAYNRAGGVPAYLDMYVNPAAAPSLIDGTIAGYLSKSGATDFALLPGFRALAKELMQKDQLTDSEAQQLAGSKDFLMALQQHNILMKEQDYIKFHDSAVRNYLVRKRYL